MRNAAAGVKMKPPMLSVFIFLGFAYALPYEAHAQNRCLNVPAQTQQTILDELLEINGSPRLSKAQAVLSNDFTRAYFVSVIMYAPGIEDGQMLTWLVPTTLDNPGIWYAADRVTDEFSYVPYAGDTQIGYVRDNDGYRESQQCARGRTDAHI